MSSNWNGGSISQRVISSRTKLTSQTLQPACNSQKSLSPSNFEISKLLSRLVFSDLTEFSNESPLTLTDSSHLVILRKFLTMPKSRAFFVLRRFFFDGSIRRSWLFWIFKPHACHCLQSEISNFKLRILPDFSELVVENNLLKECSSWKALCVAVSSALSRLKPSIE